MPDGREIKRKNCIYSDSGSRVNSGFHRLYLVTILEERVFQRVAPLLSVTILVMYAIDEENDKVKKAVLTFYHIQWPQ